MRLEWIRAKMQAIRLLNKEHEEKLQRSEEIQAMKRRIRDLDKEERHQIEKSKFSKGVSKLWKCFATQKKVKHLRKSA